MTVLPSRARAGRAGAPAAHRTMRPYRPGAGPRPEPSLVDRRAICCFITEDDATVRDDGVPIRIRRRGPDARRCVDPDEAEARELLGRLGTIRPTDAAAATLRPRSEHSAAIRGGPWLSRAPQHRAAIHASAARAGVGRKRLLFVRERRRHAAAQSAAQAQSRRTRGACWRDVRCARPSAQPSAPRNSSSKTRSFRQR